MILLIDNYDSFTWNLVQRLGEIDPSLEPGRDLLVIRNDRITPDEAEALDAGRGPTHLIISPGPCSPREAGVSSAMIARFAGRIPVLGVCLGHQCIGDLHAMTVRRHDIPVHGRTSPVDHDGRGIFAGIPSPMTATRYHSLIVEAPAGLMMGGTAAGGATTNVPTDGSTDAQAMATPGAATAEGWEISAWTDDQLPDGRVVRVVMGLRRRWARPGRAPLDGVQFHPESFMTEFGPRLLENFLRSAPTRAAASS